MAKHSGVTCRACGAHAPRWSGQCPRCGAWNAMVDPRETGAAVTPLSSVASLEGAAIPTGIAEFDRLFGGGLLPGSATLLYGEPGAGKSTLLSQVAASVAAQGRRALLLCAEESAAQVRRRAERLGELPESLLICCTTDLAEATEAICSSGAEVVVVDSVQALRSNDLQGSPGAPAMVRAVAEALVAIAKANGPALLLVGHVTKDGDLAGPRALEHLVDTVVSVEGDRHQALRIARAVKHRFGAVGEVGLFELGARGLAQVTDPAGALLAEYAHGVAGSALAVVLEGHRPLVIELQTLCVDAHGERGRRSTTGVDGARCNLLLAVLEARCGRSFAGLDLFASATGGLRATEPAADLPLALALVGAAENLALPAHLVAFGEVGLAGELRRVPGAERRLAEAARLGLRQAIVPAGSPDGPESLLVHKVSTLQEALALVTEPTLRVAGAA